MYIDMKENYFALFLKKTVRYLLKPLSFIPAILVAMMIFGFSAQPAAESSAVSQDLTARIVHSVNYRLHMNWTPAEQEEKVAQLEFYVRKAAHFTEYLIFAMTLSLPLYVYGVRGLRLYLWALALTAIYACTDEWHQMFVGGREPRLRDVIIDTCGGLTGLLIAHPIYRFCRRTIFSPLSLEREREMAEIYAEEHPEDPEHRY